MKLTDNFKSSWCLPNLAEMTKVGHLFLLVPVNSSFSRQMAIAIATNEKPVIVLSDDEDLLDFLTFEIENLGGRAYPINCYWASKASLSDAISILQSHNLSPNQLVIFIENSKSNGITLDSSKLIEMVLAFDLQHISLTNIFIIEKNESQVSFHHGIKSEESILVLQTEKTHVDNESLLVEKIVGFIFSKLEGQSKLKDLPRQVKTKILKILRL